MWACLRHSAVGAEGHPPQHKLVDQCYGSRYGVTAILHMVSEDTHCVQNDGQAARRVDLVEREANEGSTPKRRVRLHDRSDVRTSKERLDSRIRVTRFLTLRMTRCYKPLTRLSYFVQIFPGASSTAKKSRGAFAISHDIKYNLGSCLPGLPRRRLTPSGLSRLRIAILMTPPPLARCNRRRDRVAGDFHDQHAAANPVIEGGRLVK